MRPNKSSSSNKLNPDELRNSCDPNSFKFDTTEELDALRGFVDQPRALAGLRLGLNSTDKSFHVRVVQANGTSKSSALIENIKDIVNERGVDGAGNVHDLCYVHNFDSNRKPRLITLSRGKGRELQRGMARFAELFARQLLDAYGADEYQEETTSMQKETEDKTLGPINEWLKKNAVEGMFFKVVWDANEPLNPSRGNPAILRFTDETEDRSRRFNTQEETNEYYENRIQSMTDDQRDQFEKYQEEAMERLPGVIKSCAEARKEFVESMKALHGRLAVRVFDSCLDEAGLGDLESSVSRSYILPFRDFVKENSSRFLPQQQSPSAESQHEDNINYFAVNVLVDNSKLPDGTRPVILESDPTFVNLFGSASRVSSGTIMPDGRMAIQESRSDHLAPKAGSLLRANGGVLVIPVAKLIADQTFLVTWSHLANCLRDEEFTPQDLLVKLGYRSSDLEPESIPLNVRVVLITTRNLDFVFSSGELVRDDYSLFESKAEFVSRTDRTVSSEMEIAQFLGNCSRKEGLPHADKQAVAKIVDYASRLADDKEKLSTAGFSHIKHILIQAAYWARERHEAQDVSSITSDDIQKAMREEVYRSDAIAHAIRERISDGTIKIKLEGDRIGMINALVVFSMPDLRFGVPSVVSATTRSGRGRIVSVEHETDQSGPSHHKSVQIAEGFFDNQFGMIAPLAYQARITFEQNYSGIDGDSASIAQIYAILSSLTDTPIDQSVAITGSCNQYGEVQAIGGVNEKIEGFFDVCMEHDPDNSYSVIIPRDNVRHLMLRDDVVEAARNGKLTIYAVKDVYEGFEILTGKSKKETKDLVVKRLEHFMKKAKEWSGGNSSGQSEQDQS